MLLRFFLRIGLPIFSPVYVEKNSGCYISVSNNFFQQIGVASYSTYLRKCVKEAGPCKEVLFRYNFLVII
jgi:hypothetical protein